MVSCGAGKEGPDNRPAEYRSLRKFKPSQKFLFLILLICGAVNLRLVVSFMSVIFGILLIPRSLAAHLTQRFGWSQFILRWLCLFGELVWIVCLLTLLSFVEALISHLAHVLIPAIIYWQVALLFRRCCFGSSNGMTSAPKISTRSWRSSFLRRIGSVVQKNGWYSLLLFIGCNGNTYGKQEMTRFSISSLSTKMVNWTITMVFN